jgi:hypothetical protein
MHAGRQTEASEHLATPGILLIPAQRFEDALGRLLFEPLDEGGRALGGQQAVGSGSADLLFRSAAFQNLVPSSAGPVPAGSAINPRHARFDNARDRSKLRFAPCVKLERAGVQR